MMAGAPGARGSAVILSSSAETGWNPIPARATGEKQVAALTATTIAAAANGAGRRSGTIDLTREIFMESRTDGPAGTEAQPAMRIDEGTRAIPAAIQAQRLDGTIQAPREAVKKNPSTLSYTPGVPSRDFSLCRARLAYR